MKKIIGILGVAVIAMTLFYTNNTVNTVGKDINLNSLLAMNTANAETSDAYHMKFFSCTFVHIDRETGIPQWYPGQELSCYGGFESCTSVPCYGEVIVGH